MGNSNEWQMKRRTMKLGIAVLAAFFFMAGAVAGAERTTRVAPVSIPESVANVDGFTEPYRTIDVAAAETGILATIDVREGDAVKKDDVLATLDRGVHVALLAIADQAMRSRGALDAAMAEQHLREDRLQKLELLRSKGHARQEEVERARADLEIAKAQVRSAREEHLIKQLEYQKIQAQLQRRTLRAPIDGIVTKIDKDPGEYVAPNDAYVMTLVQLDPLLATFSIPSAQAVSLSVGQQVTLQCGNGVYAHDASETMDGIVDFIAPVTDAESGTVRVKVRIDNPDGRFRSGERCTLRLSGAKGNGQQGRISRGAGGQSPAS